MLGFGWMQPEMTIRPRNVTFSHNSLTFEGLNFKVVLAKSLKDLL